MTLTITRDLAALMAAIDQGDDLLALGPLTDLLADLAGCDPLTLRTAHLRTSYVDSRTCWGWGSNTLGLPVLRRLLSADGWHYWERGGGVIRLTSTRRCTDMDFVRAQLPGADDLVVLYSSRSAAYCALSKALAY